MAESGCRRSHGFVLAIDGPAGSGKSTTARGCARRLGFHYLDTGAMYRAITLKVIDSGIEPENKRLLARILRTTEIGLDWRQGKLRVELDGSDVSREIRTPRVSELVSEVSAVPAVRKVMVIQQRRAAGGRNLVCEGRDIGSVVFPDADLKVFLDCATGERARRRERELQGEGLRTSRKAVVRNLVKRDRIDSGRRIAPLLRVPDALLIDTSMLTIEEQIAIVCSLARRRMAGRRGAG